MADTYMKVVPLAQRTTPSLIYEQLILMRAIKRRMVAAGIPLPVGAWSRMASSSRVIWRELRARDGVPF